MSVISVYKVIEIVGTSTDSWEDATKSALSLAAKSLRDLRIAEVTKLDVTLDDNGQVSQYRTKLNVSFKFEGTYFVRLSFLPTADQRRQES